MIRKAIFAMMRLHYVELNYPSSVYNVNVFNDAQTAGWDGIRAINLKVTVGASAIIGNSAYQPIATFGAITGGTGYTPGVYNNVALVHTGFFSPAGINATANVTVNSLGHVSAVALVNPGEGFIVGNSLTGTIPGGSGWQVLVGSITTTYALTVPVFPAGSKVVIYNNNYIVGKGGNGCDNGTQNWVTGWPGGAALSVAYPTTIYNNGTIAGGGGGGGQGVDTGNSSCGGGGGAGQAIGLLGGGFTAGFAGTLTTGGGGATGGGGYHGGAGGNLGVAGGAGTGAFAGASAGGAAGYYLVGSAYVTWAVTGTRLGQVS